MSGMFGAVSSPKSQKTKKSVEWYTPRWVFERLQLEFDLDPCSPHDCETYVPAVIKYTIFDDGRSKPWFGRVWLNPPYGPETGYWMKRLIDHGCGIAMVFSRTDAEWCQEALLRASAVLFLKGRIDFVPGIENRHKESRAGAGTVMFAFGNDCVGALRRLKDLGVYFEGQRCLGDELVRDNPVVDVEASMAVRGGASCFRVVRCPTVFERSYDRSKEFDKVNQERRS